MKRDTMVQASSGYDYVMSHPKEISEHMGKWMLIYDNKIVSSDKDLIKIFKQFQKDNPKKTPFVMKLPNNPNMLL